MAPFDIAAMNQDFARFQELMRRNGGVCTPFSHGLWSAWQGRPDSLRGCEIMACRFLQFRKRGGNGFIANLLTPAGIDEITRDLAATSHGACPCSSPTRGRS